MTEQAHLDPQALTALFAPYDRTDAPGFAVGVALPSKTSFRRGFGMASIELPVALSPSIRMRIGSTSKHFTVLCVMLLAEEGRLSLDDTPRRHLPELPAWADAITIRQLMAHTSGMRDSLDLILHSAGPGVAMAPDYQLTLLSRLDSVNFAPGTGWNYNNGGYVLLTEIVARVSGQPFATFLQERVLEPVGMHDTMLRPLDTDLVPNSATLHVPTPEGGWRRGVFGAPIGGEGGIVSTVDDMLRWLAHLHTPTVGTAETWTAMQTPLASNGYGLGLFKGQHRGLETIHHAGGVIGGSSQMLTVPSHGLDIILISNGRSALDIKTLVDAIIDHCIPGLPPPEPSAEGEAVSGTYYSAETGRMLALAAAEGVQRMRFGGMTLPAHRDADGALSIALLPTDLKATPSEDGAVLSVSEFGVTDRLDRVTPPPEAAVPAIAGHYANAAAGLAAVIAGEGAKGTLRIESDLGGTTYALTPIGPDLWEALAAGGLPLAATIETSPEGFRFTSGRTTRLRFTRTG